VFCLDIQFTVCLSIQQGLNSRMQAEGWSNAEELTQEGGGVQKVQKEPDPRKGAELCF